MTKVKLPCLSITIACTITWGLVNFTSNLSSVWAKPYRPTNNIPSNIRALFIPPILTKEEKPDFSSDGRPGNRDGAGSRGNCDEENQGTVSDVTLLVTAIMPISRSGKTVSERPTFWFYVPDSPQEVSSGEFVVQDEARNDVYRTAFRLPKTPGFVSISLQSSKVPLESNKWYRWYFKLFCSSKKLSVPIMVRGWVQRIPFTPALRSQLDAAKPREDIVYTRNLIWYDAIDHLAELRLNNPSSSTLNEAWKNLLGAKGVGLEGLSQKPVVGAVISSPSTEN